MAPMPYVVGTDPCTYLLSDDGICVRAQSTGHTKVSAGVVETPHAAVIGAQFVAAIDVNVPGGLVGGLEIGSAALFVKQDENGRFVLFRTAPIRSVQERGLKKRPPSPVAVRASSDPSLAGDETTLTLVKPALGRPSLPSSPAPVVAPPPPDAPTVQRPPPREALAPDSDWPTPTPAPTAHRSPPVHPPPRPGSSSVVAPPPAPVAVPPARETKRVPSPLGTTRPILPAPPIFQLPTSGEARPMSPSVIPSPWDEPPTHRIMRDDMRKPLKKKKK